MSLLETDGSLGDDSSIQEAIRNAWDSRIKRATEKEHEAGQNRRLHTAGISRVLAFKSLSGGSENIGQFYRIDGASNFDVVLIKVSPSGSALPKVEYKLPAEEDSTTGTAKITMNPDGTRDIDFIKHDTLFPIVAEEGFLIEEDIVSLVNDIEIGGTIHPDTSFRWNHNIFSSPPESIQRNTSSNTNPTLSASA